MNFIAVWKVGYRDEIESGISSEEAIVISRGRSNCGFDSNGGGRDKQAIQAQEAFVGRIC